MNDVLLEARGVRRAFTGVVAVDGVDFRVRSGEIHALMGENGAGKSTLLKVLTGVYGPDEGQIVLEGQPVRFDSPQAAVTAGISTVYQEINLAPNLSVAENICLGREQRGALGIRWRDVEQRATRALAKLGVRLDVRRALGSYPIAIRQLAAIARALDVSCKVLVLDEPTSSLDRHEVRQLFDVLRRLREEGLGVVFVTHFLEQVYEISDRITVLRNGRLVGEFETAGLDRVALVSAMLGREPRELEAVPKTESEEHDQPPVLSAKDLGRRGSVQGVTLDLTPGTVLGLAGLLGSGRTETVRLLFGVDAPTGGQLHIGGKPVRRLTPRKAIRRGLGLSPEDRKAEGILPDLSIRENMLVVLQSRRGWWRRIARREQRRLVDEMIAQLRIATTDAEKPIQLLSGGNQQKALLARWLVAQPRVLLLDEPTRGIDVGAKFEIAALIERLRAGGMAFVFVSSELEELVRSSTKVAVFRDRRMIGELRGEEVSEDRIVREIAGEQA